jgi:hypothetical protein
MSIELNLESIAKSLSVIAEHVSKSKQLELPLSAPVPAAAPVVTPAATPAPVAVVPPLPSPVAAPVPAGVTPVPPPSPVPAVTAPFADAAGLMEYVKTKYRALGPIKGALIQNVLTEIGCRNVNEVTAGNYGLFYQKVEALS